MSENITSKPKAVPNASPSGLPVNFRLAIVGEAPGREEEIEGKPFVGSSGRLLRAFLGQLGVDASQCFIGNVCQIRPPDNDISRFDWNSDEIQCGLQSLRHDLAEFNPHCVLLLGATACRAFGDSRSITSIRGTIFKSPTFGYKCVAAYHPAAVLRYFGWAPIFKFDLHRAYQQSFFADYRPPQRSIIIGPSIDVALSYLDNLITRRDPIAIDIEGYPDEIGMKCISLCRAPDDGIVIPFRRKNGSSYWTLEEECEVWKRLAAVLESPDVPKILQNALYDTFVLAWRHNILVRNVQEDTMMKHWELYCEFDKNLGFISSLYTEEPYYKDEIGSQDEHEFWLYCGKDGCVTHESDGVMEKQLVKHKPSFDHYRFNVQIQRPYLYMELRGCKLNKKWWEEQRDRTWNKIVFQQEVVNMMSGREFNVKSTPQKIAWLYEDLKLPPQMDRDPATGQMKISTDFEAICRLYMMTKIPALIEVVKLIKLRTRFSDLHKIQPYVDGRVRCSYNAVGTDTGRLSSSTTPIQGPMLKPELKFVKGKLTLTYKTIVDDVGTNLQNQTKALREGFEPDNEDFDFFQYDLSGADAWTVAADLASVGYDLMLQHLLHGIKPSKVIVLVLDGVRFDPRKYAELKTLTDKVSGKDWRYTCAKRVQHGSNYGMKEELTAQVLLKDSVAGWVEDFLQDKEQKDENFLFLSPKEVKRYQDIYMRLYNVEARRDLITKQLKDHGYIDSASGHRRRFLGIRDRSKPAVPDINVALSQAPQGNTTYATNLALHRMFYDLDNRTPRGFMRAEPLIMIHDALAGQAHKSQRSWCEAKFEEWFNNPMIIAGEKILIPAEGGWGPNWKAA
jgi:uracil-DNA glycosylase family 4